MCWSLSLQFLLKKEEERHGLSRKKYGHMKVQYKKKKKNVGTWRSLKKENKKRKKKDSHGLKRIYIGREIIQKEFPFHPSQSIHVHILIWLYDLIFSLDPVFDIAIYVRQVCLIFLTLPWAPHIAITIIRMKKRQVKCLVRTYTHWAIWESQMTI